MGISDFSEASVNLLSLDNINQSIVGIVKSESPLKIDITFDLIWRFELHNSLACCNIEGGLF